MAIQCERQAEFWCGSLTLEQSLVKVFALSIRGFLSGQKKGQAALHIKCGGQTDPCINQRLAWATHHKARLCWATHWTHWGWFPYWNRNLRQTTQRQTDLHHLWQLDCSFSSWLFSFSYLVLWTISLRHNSIEDPFRPQYCAAAAWTIPSSYKAQHSVLLSFN